MTKHTDNARNEKEMMEKLKEILLGNDRAKIKQLEAIIETKEDLSQRVNPIIEEHIGRLKEKLPDQYLQEMDVLMEEKIKSSSEDILNTIYPVLGKMIKKYITHQFQLLKESIDHQIKKTFSSQGIWGRIKASLFGVKSGDLVLSDLDKPKISEIFIIQRDSGLLLGSASIKKTIDQDVVAGMLTAIKAFVEDAFMEGEQDLGMIEYDTHRIYIQNFPAFYIAVALSGSVSALEKDELSNKLLDFAEREITNKLIIPTEEGYEYVSEQLKVFFIGKKTQLID